MPDATEIKLIHGDCLEEMAKLEAGSIDLIFTSPPYNLGTTSGGGFAKRDHSGEKVRMNHKGSKWDNAALADGYNDHADNMPYPEYVKWQKECLTAMWRLLSPAGAIFYNHKPRVQSRLLQTPLDLNPGLPMRQIVIWKRAGGINFAPTHFVPMHEWIVIFAKGDFELRDRAVSGFGDVWEIPQEQKNLHPAPVSSGVTRTCYSFNQCSNYSRSVYG